MTLISKVLPISCAQGSLGLHALVEKGVWMGEASHLEKLLFILSREAQRAAERGEWLRKRKKENHIYQSDLFPQLLCRAQN